MNFILTFYCNSFVLKIRQSNGEDRKKFLIWRGLVECFICKYIWKTQLPQINITYGSLLVDDLIPFADKASMFIDKIATIKHK